MLARGRRCQSSVLIIAIGLSLYLLSSSLLIANTEIQLISGKSVDAVTHISGTEKWTRHFSKRGLPKVYEEYYSNEQEDNVGSVILTQIIFRHGDRSPSHSYPNDPHKNDWKEGLGQLTKIGMIQAYQLGQYLKHRYRDLLNGYSHEEVYIRSTGVDRALMTAECVVAGLFPMNTSSTRDNTMPSWPLGAWQPVPIQAMPSDSDRLLHPVHSCDYMKNLNKELEALYATERKMIHDQVLMLTLSYFTGMAINVTSLKFLADIIYCQKNHNMSRAEWLTPDVEEKLIDYRKHRPNMTVDDAKYLSGTLMDTLITNMLLKTNNESDRHKMYLYSGHDTTVAPLLAVLGVNNQLQVPYTAAIILELHLIEGQHYVKILYRNNTEAPPIVLVAKRCNLNLCPLSVFHQLYQAHILTDEEYFDVCSESPVKKMDLQENLFPILVAVLVALIGLNVYLAFKACSYWQQLRQGPRQEQYALLQTTEDDSDSEAELQSVNASAKILNGLSP